MGVPNIDDVKLENDFLVYQATVETFPKIEVQGLNEIEVERQVANVSDSDVDTMIENLQKQRQTFETKDGALEDGDEATFDFEGSIDGEKFEGGSAEDYRLIIGSGRMIPGFEDGMKGMKAGEEKVITVTFPEDYQAENLKGKEANFKINLKAVKTPKLPELDEALFEVKNAARNQVKHAAFDALIEKNEFDVPKAMLEQEIERQREQMVQRFAAQFGGNTKGFDKNTLPNELFEEPALRAVRLGVIVNQLIESQKIELDQDRVTAFIAEAAENYEEPQEVIDYYTNDKQQRAGVEAVVLEDQVVDYILSQAKVSEKEVKYQELLASQQAAMM